MSPAPQLLQMGSGPSPEGSVEAEFMGQLQDFMGSAEQDVTTGDESRKPPEQVKKQELPPQSVIVAIFAAMLPTPQPAGFGLPSAGDQAGPAPNTPDATQAPSVKVDAAADLEIVAPTPSTKSVASGPDTQLAFALRLVDRMVEPAIRQPLQALVQRPDAAAQITPATPRPIAPAVEAGATAQPNPAPIAAPATAAQITLATPRPIAPAVEATVASQPIRSGAAMPQTAATSAPPVEVAPQTPDSGSSMSDRGAQKQQVPRKAEPRPERPAAGQQTLPAVERAIENAPGLLRRVAPAAQVSAPKEIPVQTAGPAPTDASPLAMRPPAPSSSVAAAVSTEHVSAAPPAVPLKTAPEVTEISLSVPLGQADSGAEERVAIRMVQRGAEIHVSVRAPDHEVAQSLRQDLSRLASSLDEAGFRAEAWRPGVASVAAPSSAQAQRDLSQDTPHRGATGPDPRSGGQHGQGSGEQKRRQQDERPRWVAELEQHRNR